MANSLSIGPPQLQKLWSRSPYIYPLIDEYMLESIANERQVAVVYDLLGISFNKITSLTKKNEKVINKLVQAFIKKT